MNTYIALDVEAGGVVPEVSILTAYFAVLDDKFALVDELSLAIKPDDHVYHVTAEALEVNGINLIEHEKIATTAGAAGGKLREFLIKSSNLGAIKLIPIGHGVAGDLNKVYEEVLNKKEAQKYISWRVLDTGVIAQFLRTCGKLPESVTAGLDSLVEYFGIERRKAHDAKNDTLMTVDVLKALIKIGG